MFWTQKILVSLMFFLGAGATAVGLYFKDEITKKLSKAAYSFARYSGGIARMDLEDIGNLISSIATSDSTLSSALSTLSLSTEEVEKQLKNLQQK